MENIGESKTMLIAKGNVQTIIGGCGLKLKIKRPAKSFAQRKSPRLVNPPAKRSMNHQLHAAAFIEKPLRYNCSLSRNVAQNRASRENIFHNLFRSALIQPTFLFQPGYC